MTDIKISWDPLAAKLVAQTDGEEGLKDIAAIIFEESIKKCARSLFDGHIPPRIIMEAIIDLNPKALASYVELWANLERYDEVEK